LIAATGVNLLLNDIITGLLEEKLTAKRFCGLFNCKKQDDLNAMAIKTNSLPNFLNLNQGKRSGGDK
jgi:hypothetical protein